MNWNNCPVLLSFIWILSTQVRSQLSENTPPTMWLDRDLRIYENETIGSKITQVHGKDAEGGRLIYGLEPKLIYGGQETPQKLPFRIDLYTGTVYLNDSLKGKAGHNLNFYVTAFDGELTAKSEVNVIILDPKVWTTSSQQNRPPFPIGNMPFTNSAGIHSKLPPNLQLPLGSKYPYVTKQITNETSYTKPTSQQKTYPETNIGHSVTSISTQLKPVFIEKEIGEFSTIKKLSNSQTTASKNSKKDKPKQSNELLVNPSTTSTLDMTATLIPVISMSAVFLIVGMIAVFFKRKMKLRKLNHSKGDMIKETSGSIVLCEDPGLNMQEWRGPTAFSNRYERYQSNTNYSQDENRCSGKVKNMDGYEFPRHHLKFFNILGEGAFGQVWKCEALDMKGKETGACVVAVKTLKKNANEKERSDLISEVHVMKMLESHPNIVRLLGCCTDKDPIFLIMEYVSNGKLQSYLRNSRAERYYNNMHGPSKSLTSRDLTSFVYQVAKGMEFLSKNGIIHRDLAARNVLITEERICKVADFGFARDVIASHVYERKSEGRLPIRWMAPESLYDNLYSVKSDVWSFGILIWEVVTLGSTPYPGMSAAEVMKKVRDGYRLDKPEHCRRELYNIMYYCWDKDSKERPSFSECVVLLEKLLMTETDYIELERFPDHSYYNMMSLSGEKL